MTKTHNVASFILRFTQELWQDDQGEPHVRWRGHIRHVQGDEEDRFTDFTEAVAFIQHYLTHLTLDSLADGKHLRPDKVLHESFNLWEQFAARYTDLMFRAMEQTIKQSEAFRERVNEAGENALKAWRLPVQPNQTQILEALSDLQIQIQSLSDKIEALEKALQQKEKREVDNAP